MNEIAIKTKKISQDLLKISEKDRVLALKSIAEKILENETLILQENEKDILEAKKNNLSDALIDRLKLTKERLKSMANGCLEIANSPQVVGLIDEEKKRSDGLIIQKERIPLGVILMIFESRPNVVVDASALAIKSGNAIMLKGGKEAEFSNSILGEIIHEATQNIIPKDSIVVLDSKDRNQIAELLKLRGIIDLVIPRGGEGLVHYVYENSKIPVIAHYKGLCHIYIDNEVEEKIVLPIILNAKTQRPGVCNAVETLLYHQDISSGLMEKIFSELQSLGVTLFVDEKTSSRFKDFSFKTATKETYHTEYLALSLSVKAVENLDEAISHIREHGSNHTEAILSTNLDHQIKFQNSLDASAIAINASTRFNDGGELGLGAELGISTTKLHSYGPMGAREMTTTRYILKGTGQIRS